MIRWLEADVSQVTRPCGGIGFRGIVFGDPAPSSLLAGRLYCVCESSWLDESDWPYSSAQPDTNGTRAPSTTATAATRERVESFMRLPFKAGRSGSELWPDAWTFTNDPGSCSRGHPPIYWVGYLFLVPDSRAQGRQAASDYISDAAFPDLISASSDSFVEVRLDRGWSDRSLSLAAGRSLMRQSGMTQTSSLVSVYRCSRKRWPMESLDQLAECAKSAIASGRHHFTVYSCGQSGIVRPVLSAACGVEGRVSVGRPGERVWSFSDASGRRGPDAGRMAAPTAS